MTEQGGADSGTSGSVADDPASQRREEVGKLQEDRSKAVIAKAISEATEAVEKASPEAQSYTADVREGSDGTLPSRMSSPTEQFEKSTEAMLSTPQRRTSHRGSESEHVASHRAKRGTTMRPRSPRPVTDMRNPVETRRDGRTDGSWSPSAHRPKSKDRR